MFSALLAGGLSALGGLTDSVSGLLSPFLGMASARDTNRTMRQIAAQNREWMEKMSNTAHQREVKDLRAAGLNPILSAGGLQGASTPSVSTDYTQHAYTPDFSGVGKGLAKVGQAAQIFSNVKNTEANTALQQAQEDETLSRDLMNQSQSRLFASSAELNRVKTVQAEYEAKMSAINYEYYTLMKKYGADRASYEVEKKRAEASKAMTEALFWNSPEGRSVFSAQQHAKAYPGVISSTDSGSWSGEGGVSGFGFGVKGSAGGSHSRTRTYPAWMSRTKQSGTKLPPRFSHVNPWKEYFFGL